MRTAGGVCFAPSANVVVCIASELLSEEKKSGAKEKLLVNILGE